MLLIHEKRAQYVENGTDEPNGEFQTTSEYPSNPPPPMPPSFAKVEIYKWVLTKFFFKVAKVWKFLREINIDHS